MTRLDRIMRSVSAAACGFGTAGLLLLPPDTPQTRATVLAAITAGLVVSAVVLFGLGWALGRGAR